jgi:hypothetical protein
MWLRLVETVAGETGVWEVLVQMNLQISSVQERSTSFNIFKALCQERIQAS